MTCSLEHPEHGPCTDVAMCLECWLPVAVMRPVGETYGLHADDCSLPERHFGPCVGGGVGHPVAEVVRGWWMGFEQDVIDARRRHAGAP